MSNERKRKVLVIDDIYDSVRPILTLLKRENYEANYAETGDKALAMLEQDTPDLILLDVVLGDDSGFDVFRKIRSRPATRDVPILFLSGVSQVEDKVTGLKLGANDFIPKPYHILELSARIALQIRIKDQDRLLREKNHELTKAYNELRDAQARIFQGEKLATIGRLAAELAHELSTPLSFMSSNLKILTDYIRDVAQVLNAYGDLANASVNGESLEYLRPRAQAALDVCADVNLASIRAEAPSLVRDCLEGSEFMSRLTTSLQEYSKDEYEDRVPSNVNQLVERALLLVRKEFGERVAVRTEFGALPEMVCIPSRMTQLFVILFMNAAQAIKSAGEVRIVTRVADGNIAVTVTDTGCGIKTEHLPRIFEPFFTTKPAAQGTGLGLSIAQKIVAFHGGQISASSEVGKGTAVQVVLPAVSKS